MPQKTKMKKSKVFLIVVFFALVGAFQLYINVRVSRAVVLPFMRYESAEAAFEGSKPFGATLVGILESGDFALIEYKELFSGSGTTALKFTYKTENGYVMMKSGWPKANKLTADGVITVFYIDGNMFILIVNNKVPDETTVTDSLNNTFVIKTKHMVASAFGVELELYVTDVFAAVKIAELPESYSVTINGTEYTVYSKSK